MQRKHSYYSEAMYNNNEKQFAPSFSLLYHFKLISQNSKSKYYNRQEFQWHLPSKHMHMNTHKTSYSWELCTNYGENLE